MGRGDMQTSILGLRMRLPVVAEPGGETPSDGPQLEPDDLSYSGRYDHFPLFRAKEMNKARAALVAVLRENPDSNFGPFDIRVFARGRADHGALSLALSDLLEEGVFVRDDHGCIRMAT